MFTKAVAACLLLVPVVVLPAALGAASPHKGTEILWDKFGVAHVYAKTTEDLFYGYGYGEAKSHGDLLLHLYGESRGRGAEYFGASHLEDDKWIWTNSIPQRSELWLKQQSTEFRTYLEAFAKGINDYAAAHPEALSEEARRVLPITALDAIEHTQHIVQFTYLAPRRLANDATTAAAPETASLLETPEDIASNGWAIAPSHTAAGKTLLLGNPHLPWGGWQTYYKIQLTAPGNRSLRRELSGVPGVALHVQRLPGLQSDREQRGCGGFVSHRKKGRRLCVRRRGSLF